MTRRELAVSLAALFSWPRLLLPGRPQKHDSMHVEGVSMIRLIANPSAFDGRRLRLLGYLEGNGPDKAVGLYLSEPDGRIFNLGNSIALRVEDLEVRTLIGKYITLVGTYHAPPSQFTEFNGYIDHISGLKRWNMGDLARE